MTTPIVHPETPRVALASGCILGEGALWDHRTETLLFVDIKDPSVWRYRPGDGRHERVPVAEPVGFIALTRDPDTLVAGFKSGLVRLHLPDGKAEPIVSPEPDRPGNRINDGVVGPDGSLYFGTMDDAEAAATGSFWRFDGRRLERFGRPVCIANGPAISPDGRILYTVDTTERLVEAHDLEAGMPRRARPFVRFDAGSGHPDGIAVDADGHVWICHWGASRITRFAPDGTAERVLPVPTAQVTKCAFGGPGLATLFITTAGIGRDPHLDPMAGHLFVVAAGTSGQRAHIFEG